MAWVYLIVAGLFEMSGVLMINKLNKDRNATSFLLLLAGFGLSFPLSAEYPSAASLGYFL
ncbi:hypothetical protein J19TS2_61640 [Cohnella xylanilytica]|nr:hypothetical protein J19TS2_61640 [Cohnella xylanilytica]